MSMAIFMPPPGKISIDDREPGRTSLRAGGTIGLAGRGLARAPALGGGRGLPRQRDRARRGPADRVRPRPRGLVAELARAASRLRGRAPLRGLRPPRLRGLAPARRRDLDLR